MLKIITNGEPNNNYKLSFTRYLRHMETYGFWNQKKSSLYQSTKNNAEISVADTTDDPLVKR